MEERREVWRIWVDPQRRIVSFHEVEGGWMLEFHSWEMFIHAVDEYASRRYRYQ